MSADSEVGGVVKGSAEVLNQPKVILKRLTKAENVVSLFEESTAHPLRFNAFMKLQNMPLNRFPSAILYDKSRVILQDNRGSDYYHASYVDSYDLKGGYIFAQAPFNERTEIDFWRLCGQVKPALIVLLGSSQSRDDRQKVQTFWPGQGRERKHPSVNVRTLESLEERGYNIHTINVIPGGVSSKKGHRIHLIHFTKWLDDKEVPDGLLDLRAIIKITLAKHPASNSVILFVCPSGIHRCGTFAALDIILDRIKAEKKVGMDQTISILKSQRYGCVSFFEHYKILQDIIVNYAITTGLTDPNAIGGGRRL